MKIISTIETQIHLLKHFYYVDSEYINELKNQAIADNTIKSQLADNSSKIFNSFAENPSSLIEKIEAKLESQEILEGKNEFTLIFDEIVGFDLLVEKGLDDKSYFVSRKLNVIVVNNGKDNHLITAFPGKYAPALPNRELMTNEVFNISNTFWENYKMANALDFESIEKRIIEINISINKAWALRYQDYDKALGLLEETKVSSKDIKYIEGDKYAEFCIKSVQLLRTTANEDTFKYLRNFLEYIATTNNKLASVRCLSTLANQYDLFGMYSKGMGACVKAIKIAEANKYLSDLGDLFSTYGFINIRISDFNQASSLFEKSLEIRNKLGDKASIAASYNQLARANLLNKNIKDAERFYLKSIEIRKENHFYGALLWSYIGIASLYMETKEYDKTLNYFGKIDALKLHHNIKDKRSTIMCLHGEGQIKNNLAQFEEAKEPLRESLEIAEEIGVKPIQYQIHFELYKSYSKLNNSAKALYHYEKYHAIKEEVLNEENINKLKQQQISFAVEKSEKEAEIERLKNVELKKANDEITKQKEEIEEIHQEISDSINYAQKIQEAVLPSEQLLSDLLSDHFVLFKPKDKVSGDFYWWTNINNQTIITAADCTGHGVPGAFMSMLGVSSLREIVIKEQITNPSEILSRLRSQIIKTLKQTGESGTQKDGMDMAIISIDHETNTVQFSGANNPLYIITNDELRITNKESDAINFIDNSALKVQSSKFFYEVKPDKMPIAIYEKMDDFITHEIQLQKGDQLFMFSDGYADQFGGPKNKKFKYKPFKRLLIENASKAMSEQKEILNSAFEQWRGAEEQVDDVVVLGIRM